MVELRTDKFRELKGKKAIDRAAKVLDRLEQRITDYDAQTQRITDEYLKPLQLLCAPGITASARTRSTPSPDAFGNITAWTGFGWSAI